MTPAIFEAAMFATVHHDKPHRGKARRGGRGVPYAHHVFDVAGRVVAAGLNSEHAVLAAILHDVVEDTHATIEDVQKFFGPLVAKYVSQLTLPVEIHDDLSKKVQHQMRLMFEMDWECRAVKIADKSSNVYDLVADPPHWGIKAITGYAHDSKAVVDVVRMLPDQPEYIVRLINSFDQAYLAVRESVGR